MTYPIFYKMKNFVINYKNPQEIAEQKDKMEREIGWVEGIYESLPQVHAGNIMYYVIMNYVQIYIK